MHKSISNSQFIVSLQALKKIFSFTTNLCQALQVVNVDLVQCCQMVDTIADALRDLRNEEEFSILFKEAEKISKTQEIVAPGPHKCNFIAAMPPLIVQNAITEPMSSIHSWIT